MLLVNGLYDPSSGYSGAEAMRDALDNGSVLVPFDGDGHLALDSDASGCSYEVVRTFLLDGTTPVTSCP
jgi:pimeloyl-ACP methyl ester carboxylesterase